MTPRARRSLFLMLGTLGAALSAPAPAAPVQPGQVWLLTATTADGETFRTALHLDATPPTGTPATYRADRGALLVDLERGTLIALDLLDARQGGLGLACVVDGPLDARPLSGVLATGTLGDLPARLETALAVTGVTRTPAERAAAVQELRLGTCTLMPAP